MIDYEQHDDSEQWHQNEIEHRHMTENALLANDHEFAKWNDNQDRLERKLEMELNDNMSFNDLVPSDSKYLKKEDVGEGGLILTIAGFSREILKGDGGDEEKTVLHFNEDVKPMVLNHTNAQLIPVVTGAMNAGEAKGKQIVVYNDPTISFGSKITGGLRIKSAQAAQPSAPSAPSDIPYNDEPAF